MLKNDVYKILKTINGLYPRFDINQEAAKIWVESLENIDYEIAMKNIKNHANKSNFAPSIAEVRGTLETKIKQSIFNDVCETTGEKYKLI